MPDFHLNAEEAEALAGFLTTSTVHKLPGDIELPAGDKDRGGERFRTARCVNCHVVDRTSPSAIQRVTTHLPQQTTERGCLANEPGTRMKAPAFALDQADRTAASSGPETAPRQRTPILQRFTLD